MKQCKAFCSSSHSMVNRRVHLLADFLLLIAEPPPHPGSWTGLDFPNHSAKYSRFRCKLPRVEVASRLNYLHLCGALVNHQRKALAFIVVCNALSHEDHCSHYLRLLSIIETTHGKPAIGCFLGINDISCAIACLIDANLFNPSRAHLPNIQ